MSTLKNCVLLRNKKNFIKSTLLIDYMSPRWYDFKHKRRFYEWTGIYFGVRLEPLEPQ